MDRVSLCALTHTPACVVQVYHPNIDLEGKICLNILREDWKPVLSISSVVYGLQFLFLVSACVCSVLFQGSSPLLRSMHGCFRHAAWPEQRTVLLTCVRQHANGLRWLQLVLRSTHPCAVKWHLVE